MYKSQNLPEGEWYQRPGEGQLVSAFREQR